MENIKLAGCKNVRDLGGIALDTGEVKERRFLRGACLDNLTKKDIEKLVNEYKLSTIIDLRTIREKEERPDLEIQNVKYIHMPIFNDRFPGITHESQEDFDRDFKEYRLDLAKMYGGMLRGEYLEKISEIIKTIMNLEENEYSVLFHCTEGKDRTGIIATLILLILGADKQTIMDDYLYTNIVNEKKAKNIYWKVRIFKMNKIKAQNLKNIFLAKREYLESAFNVIENEWNGVEDFIENGLKISKEEIEKFRKNNIKLDK